MAYKTEDGYLNSDLFLISDYCGDSVTMTNHRYITEYAEKHGIHIERIGDTPQDFYEQRDSDEPPIIIEVLGWYHSRWLLFNVARMKNEQPDLWEQIEGLRHYPLLSDDLLSQVEEELATDAWADCYSPEIKDNLIKILVADGYSEERAEDMLDRHCTPGDAILNFYDPRTGEPGYIIESGCSVFIDTDIDNERTRNAFLNVAKCVKYWTARAEGHPQQKMLALA